MDKQKILDKISELLDQFEVKNQIGNEEYFKLLADKEVPKKFQATAKKWRKLADNLGYKGNVAYRVKAGFTFKAHAPLLGNCYQDFKYLQDWDFDDKPTSDSIVFFIPILMGLNKDKDEQLAELENFKLNITSFGEVSLLAGLILTHFNLTSERIPKNYNYIRTDTLNSDGRRLDLGDFNASGLGCDRWRWRGDGRDPVLGCFPLGVELGV